MTQKQQIEKLKKSIHDRLVDIGFYMFQTMGFPFEIFQEKIGNKTLLEQLSFINGFVERHPKSGKPIFFKEFEYD